MRRILRLLRDERGVELVSAIYILGIDVLGGLAIWLLGAVNICSSCAFLNSLLPLLEPNNETSRQDKGRKDVVESIRTGNCACIDCNCGGAKTPLETRYSSSVLIVLMERLICAASGILMVYFRSNDFEME